MVEIIMAIVTIPKELSKNQAAGLEVHLFGQNLWVTPGEKQAMVQQLTENIIDQHNVNIDLERTGIPPINIHDHRELGESEGVTHTTYLPEDGSILVYTRVKSPTSPPTSAEASSPTSAGKSRPARPTA